MVEELNAEMREEIVNSLLKGQEGLIENLVLIHSKISSLEAENRKLLNKIEILDNALKLSDNLIDYQNELVSLDYPSSYIVNAESNSLNAQSGFYGLEFAADGTSYKWTGPDNFFSLKLKLNREDDVKLAIQFIAINDNVDLESLRICIDNGSFDKAIVTDNNIISSIPSDKSSSAIIKVTYDRYDNGESTKELTDKRKLGIAINKIVIGAPEND